jgi:multidrug resistance efflux pump
MAGFCLLRHSTCRRQRTLFAMMIRLLIGLSLLTLGAAALDESVTVEQQALPYTCSLRVSAITEKAEMIASPVNWLPLSFIVEDGARVEKGEVIARFDSESSVFELGTLEKDRGVIEAELAQRLREIDNKEAEMRDRLSGLKDRLAVLAARLVRLQHVPVPDDVEIAEGRLRVARMNAAAAEKDVAKARDRFQRQMISRAEVDKVDTAFLEKKALLTYAESELEYTQLPTPAATIEQTELEIANNTLESAKIENELAEYKTIADIQREGAGARKKLIDRKITEKQDDINNTVVKAPISGYISYGKMWDEDIGVGTKMWKNFTFTKIPDLSTLAFKGPMPESVRKYFKEGDAATVALQGRQHEPIPCTVKSISTLSHDLAEKDEADWGLGGKGFGVKVFDVVFAITAVPEWVRPGMVGEAEMVASAQIAGPAVPLKFLTVRDAVSYLSVDGVFRETPGTVTQGWFVLDDPSWLGKTVSMQGEFRGNPKTGPQDAAHENLYSASGELLPVKSVDVKVGDIGWRWPWPKVTWLVGEETTVKKGDEVAKLDPQELDRRMSDEETRANEVRSRSQELEKQVELTRREGEFRLKTEQNLLRIAELKMRTVLNGCDALAVLKAELSRDQARIRHDDVARRVANEEQKKTRTMSPAEFARLQRDKRRCELRLEEAEIRLAQAQAGAGAIERSQAKLDALRQKVTVDTIAKSVEFDTFKQGRNYEQARLDLKRAEKRLEELKKQRACHVIASPADGIICYSKVWNNDSFSKVAVGNQVGPRFNIMSIPDLSHMYVSVEVPEKYFGQIVTGMPVDVQIPALSKAMLKGQVTAVDFLFENKQKSESQVGMYSSHEPLGEVIFKVRVTVQAEGIKLKPGLVGEVFFPFARR